MTNRRGFSLIEMLIAVVMLGIAIVGIGRFVGSFQNQVTRATKQTDAVAVARERIELIRADPRYTRLVALYNANDTTVRPTPYDSLRRRTLVTRTTSGGRDFTTITIIVNGKAVLDSVMLTGVVAAP